ncbi:MAG: DUF3105 domain-containing protein, partial [Acidobacteria bacterium]|nr:DUF3105 domain-containing protein [Acidobacteriota bacterium]
MGNTRRLRRAQQRRSTRSKPAPAVAGPQQSTPWKKYLLTAGVLLVLGVGVVFIASDLSNNPQGVADPPEGSEAFAVTQAVHVDGPVQYPQDPPAGGPHSGNVLECRVYDAPVVSEFAVHALEHGAVWITYQPDLAADEIRTLEGFGRRRELIVSPYPGLDSPVVATTWGTQLRVDSADDPR